MDMSPGDRRPGRAGGGGQGAEGAEQAVDMSPGEKTWEGAEGAVDMSPRDRKPGTLVGLDQEAWILEPRRAGLASQGTQPLAQSKPNQDSSSTKHCEPRVGAHWREPLKV